MSILDLWSNLFVAFLTGIPLIVFVLFCLCACLEKLIRLTRQDSLDDKRNSTKAFSVDTRLLHPRGSIQSLNSRDRRVRFSVCDALRGNQHFASNQCQMSGLMAHSSYVQRHPNYQYNSIVHQDENDLLPQTYLSMSQDDPYSANQPVARLPSFGSYLEAVGGASSTMSGSVSPNSFYGSYNGGSTQRIRRPSTPTPTNQPYPSSPKSSFDAYRTHHFMDGSKSYRRYSSPSSPTLYNLPYGSHGSHYNFPPGLKSRTPSDEEAVGYETNHTFLPPEMRTYLKYIEDDPSARQRSHSFGGRIPSRRSSRRKSGSKKRSSQSGTSNLSSTNSVDRGAPASTVNITSNESEQSILQDSSSLLSSSSGSTNTRTQSYDHLVNKVSNDIESLSICSRSRSSTSFSTASTTSFNSNKDPRFMSPEGSLITNDTLTSDQCSFYSPEGLTPDSEYLPNYCRDFFQKSKERTTIKTSFI